MHNECVNCGKNLGNSLFCSNCGVYVQVEEAPDTWRITLTVELYVQEMEKDEAQEKLDDLVARICDLDHDVVISNEQLEEG